jgi:hypothetical protein
MPFTDANTREKLPEASPKGPSSMHIKALAGKQLLCTLGTQVLASRPPKLDRKQTELEPKIHKKENLTTTINYNPLTTNVCFPLKPLTCPSSAAAAASVRAS